MTQLPDVQNTKPLIARALPLVGITDLAFPFYHRDNQNRVTTVLGKVYMGTNLDMNTKGVSLSRSVGRYVWQRNCF